MSVIASIPSPSNRCPTGCPMLLLTSNGATAVLC